MLDTTVTYRLVADDGETVSEPHTLHCELTPDLVANPGRAIASQLGLESELDVLVQRVA